MKIFQFLSFHKSLNTFHLIGNLTNSSNVIFNTLPQSSSSFIFNLIKNEKISSTQFADRESMNFSESQYFIVLVYFWKIFALRSMIKNFSLHFNFLIDKNFKVISKFNFSKIFFIFFKMNWNLNSGMWELWLNEIRKNFFVF